MEPDCQVDALDAQNVALRWGAGIGSLLYNERFDLEPSGQVKGDGDIDIKDLQFIFGRQGSNCDRQIDNAAQFDPLKPLPTDARPNDGPHPRQEQVNPNGPPIP